MRVIDPSARIIEEDLRNLSVYRRIDRCAAVCYQRPPKVSEEDAKAFCVTMIARGHLATMEFAQLHIVTDFADDVDSRFVDFARLGNHSTIISGSPRAFMEARGEYGSRIWNFLASEHPLLFAPSDPPKYGVRWAEPEEIPEAHKKVAVQFIVNRAISHELVRHRPCSFLQESKRYCRYEDDVVFIRPEWWDAGTAWEKAHQAVWGDVMEAAENAYRAMMENGLSPQQARAVLPNSTKTEILVYATIPQWAHVFSLRCDRAADPEMRRVMIPLRAQFIERYPRFFDEQ